MVTLPSLGVFAVEPQKEKLKKAPANSFVVLLFLSRGAMGLDINILSCLVGSSWLITPKKLLEIFIEGRRL